MVAVVFDRMRDAMFGRKPEEPTPIRVTESPADLQRGDVIVFWDAGDAIVATTLDCTEHASGRQRQWRWLFLSTGAMIEVLGGTNTIYEQHEVIAKDTVMYQRLTGSAQDGGMLQTFEARARDGSETTDPVLFQAGDVEYRLTGTGTFVCVRVGALDEPVWRDIAEEEGENVYFRMQSGDGGEALGIWTTDIVLLRGRRLAHAEIKGLYGA